MNTAEWHLLLNHFPVMGTVFGTLILLVGYLIKNNSGVKSTALGVFVFSALMAIPAFLTGEGAEEVAEKLPGVTESFIESHEELGEYFMIAVSVLGLLSLITFFVDRAKNKLAPILFGIILLTGTGTCILAKKVGTSGGQVRHTEIRGDVLQQQNNATEQEAVGEKDDD